MSVARQAPSILVAGAGPVGLSAALLLEQAGYEVTLVSPERPPDQRTSALFAGTIPLLERIGVWVAIEKDAAPLRSLRIADATRRLIRAPEVLFRSSEIGLDAFGFNIANRLLMDALEAAAEARGISRVAASVEAIEFGRSEVLASLSTGITIAAALIVAADGRRSRIREAAGIGAGEWRYDQSALVANLRHSLPHDDTSTEFHTEAGPFTLVPLQGQRSSLVWVDRPAESARRAGLTLVELAAEIEARSSSIMGTVTVEGPAQVFPLAGMSADRLSGDRIVLVGEAAHLFPPIGAQGLNLGYRDVAALGDVLAGPVADPGSAGRLAAYADARRGDVLARTLAVDALNRTLLSGFLPVQAMRGVGLFLLDRVPALRHAVMRQGVAGL